MDGNPGLDATVAYLARLTGQDISADQPIGLRSIHRVALASWARKEQLQVRGSLINSSAPFSIRELLAVDEDTVPARSVGHSAPIHAASTLAVASTGGIGIDIEDVASLPQAEDYREHSFYRDNFSPAEIAHCLLQPHVRASFCGLWAAKEAILKSAPQLTRLTRLIDIEIEHDGAGRPTHPNCYISISHTPHTAVAVCLPKPALAMVQSPLSIPTHLQEDLPAAPAATASGKSRKLVAALFIIAAICAACIILAVWRK